MENLVELDVRYIKSNFSTYIGHAVCPRSNDPFHIVSYYIIWVTTSSAEAKPSMFSFQRGLKGVIFVENSYWMVNLLKIG